MTPYSVWTPPFEVTSGGIRVMWGLYGWLLAKGQIVYPNAQYGTRNFIAIYPEIAQGNPLNADKIVRYILQKPGLMTTNGVPGPEKFDPSDKLVYFSRLFGGDATNTMFLPILDLHLFKDQKKPRSKTAFFVGKGVNLGKHPENALQIDRNITHDQQLLADTLNECEVLYVYDPVTAMTEIARLCGCRIVMINPTYSKEEFSVYEPGMDGISWGQDEGIALDTPKFLFHYRKLREIFENKLDQFINETQ